MASSIASEASSFAWKRNYKIISLACILHVPILPTLDQGFSDSSKSFEANRQCHSCLTPFLHLPRLFAADLLEKVMDSTIDLIHLIMQAEPLEHLFNLSCSEQFPFRDR